MRDKIDSFFLVSDTYGSGPYCRERDVHKLESEFEQIENFDDGVKDVIADLEYNLEIAINELQTIAKWKDAYPEDVFPPLTTEQYHGMCKASGISVDRVSAHVLRKIVIAYSEAAEKVLDKITGES